MAEAHVETKLTALNDNKNQSNPATVQHDTEVELRTNQNIGGDADETHGRCYSCYVCCIACCKPCMTENNPLPDSPTRFVAVFFNHLFFSSYSRLSVLCTKVFESIGVGHFTKEFTKLNS